MAFDFEIELIVDGQQTGINVVGTAEQSCGRLISITLDNGMEMHVSDRVAHCATEHLCKWIAAAIRRQYAQQIEDAHYEEMRAYSDSYPTRVQRDRFMADHFG
jgi:hypothetical protein